MTSFSEQRARVLELADEGQRQAAEGEDAAVAEELRAASRDLQAGRLSVAVVGEFKRGKSSLLDALIEQPDLFPVDTSVATNLVTTLAWGDSERVSVLVDDAEDGSERISKEISRDQIRDYVTEQGNPDNRQRARLLSIELPNDKLRDGLVLVDTPGVGGLNTEHTAVTYSFVTSADVVLFVLDALTPLSTEELDFLKTVAEHTQALIFAVTKIDQEPGYQSIIDNTREKVSAVLGRPGDELTIVPVSSADKLFYLETGDEEALESSNFPALEAELWGVLRERGAAILLLRALGRIARGLDRMISPRRTELDALTASTERDVDEAERKIDEATARIEELRKGQASWRKTLQRRLKRLRMNVDDEFDARQRRIRHTVTGLLDDEQMTKTPDEILGVIDRDVMLLASELSQQIQDDASSIARALAEETGLELNPAAPDAEIAVTASKPDLGAVDTSSVHGEGTIAGVRGFLGGAGAGGAAAQVAAVVLHATNPIGWVALGAMVFGTQSARASRRQMQARDRRERRNELAKVVMPHLDESVRQVNVQRKQLLVDTEEALSDAFDGMLLDEHERLKDEAGRIAQARKRTRAEAQARAAELRGPLDALERLRHDAEAQAKAAVNASGSGREPVAAGTDESERAGE